MERRQVNVKRDRYSIGYKLRQARACNLVNGDYASGY